MDMYMLPFFPDDIVPTLFRDIKTCLEEGDVDMSRIDDAVKRILAVKLSMGLVRRKGEVKEKLELVKDEELNVKTAKEDAYTAAQESLVLLKNENELLPIQECPKHVVLAGEAIIDVKDEVKTLYQQYDNIGAQNGGWSVRWQGYMGNRLWSGELKEKSGASSILDNLKEMCPDSKLLYPRYESFTDMDHIQAKRT
jgi:beta-glucosidase